MKNNRSFLVFVVASLLSACAVGTPSSKKAKGLEVESSESCNVNFVRYPTTADDFADDHLLYGHRGFLDVYQNHKHLGRDIIYPAGTGISPISCGKIVFYGPAQGYGTLVAVVEHNLLQPISVVNGDGETVQISKCLSIYGHLTRFKKSTGEPLPWKVGDLITPQHYLGYIQTDKLNGDGPEHLHFGIRLQSLSEAQATEPKYWFRGNDTAGVGEYKKYYADPKTFMIKLIESFHGQVDVSDEINVIHHPVGTILRSSNQQYWVVTKQDTIKSLGTSLSALHKCAVDITDEELHCYHQANQSNSVWSKYLFAKQIKFDGEPEVYQLLGLDYRTYLSYDSFLSWGGRDEDIVHYPLKQKQPMLSTLNNQGFVSYRPGSLVKIGQDPAVSVVSEENNRRPIYNWDVFTKLGYQAECIYSIDPNIEDQLIGPIHFDQEITLANARQCPAEPTRELCSPGNYVPCGCSATLNGRQECREDGKGFESCDCSEVGGGSMPPDDDQTGSNQGDNTPDAGSGSNSSSDSGTPSNNNHECSPPGSYVPNGCDCPNGAKGDKYCGDNYHWSYCDCYSHASDAGTDDSSSGNDVNNHLHHVVVTYSNGVIDYPSVNPALLRTIEVNGMMGNSGPLPFQFQSQTDRLIGQADLDDDQLSRLRINYEIRYAVPNPDPVGWFGDAQRLIAPNHQLGQPWSVEQLLGFKTNKINVSSKGWLTVTVDGVPKNLTPVPGSEEKYAEESHNSVKYIVFVLSDYFAFFNSKFAVDL